MYIPFENIDDSARVWVYQANRSFTDSEIDIIEQAAVDFCNNWATHNIPLSSSFKTFYNQFLVLALDENLQGASGCSIDSSVGLIRHLENKLQCSFMDRTQIAFVNDTDEVVLQPMNQIKEKINEGIISEHTLTFNNLVKNVGELESAWKVPAGDSWLKRYFA